VNLQDARCNSKDNKTCVLIFRTAIIRNISHSKKWAKQDRNMHVGTVVVVQL